MAVNAVGGLVMETDFVKVLEFVNVVRKNGLGRYVMSSTTEGSEIVLVTDNWTLTFAFDTDDRLIAIAEW